MQIWSPEGLLLNTLMKKGLAASADLILHFLDLDDRQVQDFVDGASYMVHSL